jgi:hypothetical protein
LVGGFGVPAIGHSRYCIQLPLCSSRLRQHRKRLECINRQFAAAGYQFATHAPRSMGKRIDSPHPPCQRRTVADETLNQFSFTRAAFSAERRLKNKSFSVVIQNYTAQSIKGSPQFCVFHL